jgi:ABC-type uncharacterized transport system substrate-binding protein
MVKIQSQARSGTAMQRRAFVTLLGGAAAWPLGASAQQTAKTPRIGFLASDLVVNHHLPRAFRQGLHDLGYEEGRNVVIEFRDAEGKLERLPTLAAELVALKVDVIVAGNVPQAMAAMEATRTLPMLVINLKTAKDAVHRDFTGRHRPARHHQAAVRDRHFGLDVDAARR